MDDERQPADGVAADRVDLDALRRERDALAARVVELEARTTTRPRRVRHVAVAGLLVVGVLSFTLSAVGWWARRNVADTEVWVERVGPLAEDPAVRAALGAWLSDEVVGLIHPEDLFAEVLPERGRLLAAPLAGAVDDFVRGRINRFLASDRFEQLWVDANEGAHRAAVKVLRGDSDVAQAQGDMVVINLVPVIDAALADIDAASPALLGRDVQLPRLTVDDLPDAATRRLGQALGVDLGEGFGQFVVYDRGRLTALQDAIDWARRGLYLLSVITVIALNGALWLSDRRRRTLLHLLAGLVLGIAVIRRLGLRGQRELLATIPDPLNRAAAEAASDRFLDPLLAVTQTLLLVLAVIAAAVAVSGPYPWAVRLRRRAAELAASVGRTVGQAGAAAEAETATSWLSARRSELQMGGVAIVVLVLLVVDLSFFGVVMLAALVVLGGALLGRIPAPGGAEATDPG